MAGELILTQVSTPTTPAASKDALYSPSAYPGRLAHLDASGNVYVLQEHALISMTADRNLTDNSTPQAAFNSPASGQITLPTLTSWEFESMYLIQTGAASGHTWSVLFAGSATITSLDFLAQSTVNVTSALTPTAANVAYQSNGAGSLPTTALVVTTSQTSAEFVTVWQRGIVRINAGGTLIPQLKLSATTSGTPKLLRNSFFRMTPFGTNTAASLGNWS